ncbi:hypothetical protein SKAU_G00025630 [Synaphobranchus kaupii]|uniref:Glycosyltransferase 2-like domain-containing protein n=1 Tax=Synaphobranchus kaupii TaxID=118154 RepID=A0A9Q1GCR2_SYNKA|nr:hypothetical protein SKAU_G00025630 [Synaphobranchus kaupii]
MEQCSADPVFCAAIAEGYGRGWPSSQWQGLGQFGLYPGMRFWGPCGLLLAGNCTVSEQALAVARTEELNSKETGLMHFKQGGETQRCLERKYPKNLPTISVVLIYLDEALSIIKRAIRSIMDKTPPHLLKEIILVDDNSSNEDLIGKLDAYVSFIHDERPGLVKRVRHKEQMGLTQARISGWKAATGDVVAILDAHIEVHVEWAEPLLARIKEDRTVVLTPVFDRVNFDDLKVIRYIPAAVGFDWALWCMYESFRPEWYKLNDESQPGKSPSIMGILVVDRLFFGEIGVLDGGMKIYGGENVELGIRVWLCGGSIEVVPCSKIAHIERAHKPYLPDLSITMKRNALRVAEVWMDEYKDNVKIAWNLPLKVCP